MVNDATKPPACSLGEILSIVKAMAGEREIHIETHDEWVLRYCSSANDQGEYLMHSVDAALNGSVRVRMTMIRPGVDDEAVVDTLRHKALAWIDEYESRDHTGSTDFGAL